MSINQTKSVDQITVSENGIIYCRESTIISDGDNLIAQKYHRWSLAPGDDISAMPANVQAIAQAAWTPEVIAAYQAMIAEHQAKAGGQP